MKRAHNSTATVYSAAPQPQQPPPPPLPPGPPPPPPNPYLNYGYAQPPVPAPHPQYPGYGYGGQPSQPAYPYATAYAPYPQAQPAPAQQAPLQNSFNQYPSYPPQAGPQFPYAQTGAPPLYVSAATFAGPSPQQFYAGPAGALAHQSSQGDPPFKRPRYDSTGALQGPPPAVAPLGFGDRGRGRGGYGGDRGRGGPPGNVGGGRGGYGVPMHYGGDAGTDMRSQNGGPHSPGAGFPMRGGYRGGRGDGRSSYDSRHAPNRGPPGAPFVPSGPASTRGSDRGGRGGRGVGRLVSGLPGLPAAAARGGRGGYESLPKGPKAGVGAPRDPRKDKKWGRDAVLPVVRDEASKRTLTDFRIAGLAVLELEWDWHAEKLKAIVANIAKSSKADEDGSVAGDDSTADMSFSTDFADASSSQPVSASPSVASVAVPAKKKLSKKQKKAEAKRLAALLAAPVEAPVEARDVASKAPVSTPRTETGPIAATESSVAVESSADEKKKDGKHGRDEEDDAGLVVAIAAAKKVKPDTDEVVTLSTLDPPTEGTRAPVAPAAPSLPSAPAPSRGATPSAPAGRENSRLRIYFSSPLASVSTFTYRDAEAAPSTQDSVLVVPKVEGGEDAGPASEQEVPTEEAADVDGEPVDGGPVDGEPIDGEAVDGTAFGNDSGDEVENALLIPRGTITPLTEEAISASEAALSTTDATALRSGPADDGSVVDAAASRTETEEPEATLAEAAGAELATPESSADRISISYARNTRRMVLDAAVVEQVRIFRTEGKIEVTVSRHPATLPGGDASAQDEYRVFKGILIEALDVDADDYVVIDREALQHAWDGSHAETLDPLLPPLQRLASDDKPSTSALDGLDIVEGASKGTLTVVAYLDRSNPLTEARWVKTGDVEGWITQLSLANGIVSEWKGKILVVDPDPAPTIQHALESWSTTSSIGSTAERIKFVAEHLANNIDNCFEILLRLTRGDRAGASSHHSAQAASVGVLAATLGAPYAEQQTQISLAVLAMFRLSVETAVKAGIAKEEVEKQVAEIVRGIPYHLIFKSLDSMWRDHRAARS